MSADAALDLIEVPKRQADTLEELYQKACAAPGPRSMQAWIFREAKAKGRLAVAERELHELEQQRFCILSKTWGTDSDAARDLLMRHGPSGIEMGRAQAEVATATEIASVCSRMIEMLTRNPPKETTNATPYGQQRKPQDQAHPSAHGQVPSGVRDRPHPGSDTARGPSNGPGVRANPAADGTARRG